MYTVDISSKAERQLKKIAKKDRQAYAEISEAISNLHDFHKLTQVRHLTNHRYMYRLRYGQAALPLRVGRYRIFFDVDNGVRIVYVQEVKRRDEHTY